MNEKLNENIIILDEDIHTHSKASERYIHVIFKYYDYDWDLWIPIEYRRTGINIQKEQELFKYLNDIYEQMKKENIESWQKEQDEFWKNKPNANVTKEFFDVLRTGGWKCVNCDLPNNPNWARRIQDLKEFGYTIATDTKRFCNKCNSNKTHLILLPIKRGINTGNGYETWTPALRKRILKLLNYFDVYEYAENHNCLPDHKFSEIRWGDDTKDENPDDMTDEEIMKKFQLLTNQRNQQKREVCRKCYQTGKRGIIFGIPFFYEGNENWDTNIPREGKDAETGCIGCAWYDIEEWREQLIKKIENKED